MNDVLEKIVARTRERLSREAPAERSAAEASAKSRKAFGLSAALRPGGEARPQKAIRVIAEIKSASPSAGTIVANPDVTAIAADYAYGGAAAISVVTEEDFFKGSRDWIERAAFASGLPILMKDFVIEESQLVRGVAAGASGILLLASLLDGVQIAEFIACLDGLQCDALVEVHDEWELERAVAGGARLIGVNNRNLRDFVVDLGTSERLATLIPDQAIRVAESGIRTRQDVDRLHAAGFHAFLVGESLLRQNDHTAAVRNLVETGGERP